MIVLVTDDHDLHESLEVAMDGAVVVRREDDVATYYRWARASMHHVLAVVVDCRGDVPRCLDALDGLGRLHRTVPLLAVVARSDPDVVYRVAQRGTSAWLPYPCESEEVRRRIIDAVGHNQVVREAPIPSTELLTELVGTSPAMRDLRNAVVRCADVDAPVLVVGETGVGKELVAHTVHRLSRRAGGPFVEANIPAIAGGLFESELFGSARGAYTGAVDKPGLFQASDGGSLFLDEIADLPTVLQPKLLRAVETQRIRRVGGVAVEPVDTRIIAATNRRLDRMVRERTFRRDLWHRLAALIIPVPPLRRRRDDIPALAHVLLARDGFEDVRLSQSAISLLRQHVWPGNVRELRTVLLRSAVLSGGSTLYARDLLMDADYLSGRMS